MTYENILFEVHGKVGVLTFNRPKVMNALNPKTLDELADVIEKLGSADAIRTLVLTGAGEKAFVAGADISEFPKMSPLQARLFAEKGQRIFFHLEKLPIPVIACVNGLALGGGCEMAMSCDFIYASERARFGQPEVNLGLIPGFGGTQRLSRLVGRAKARELCMTGEMISAAQANELGLVARVFESDRLFSETMRIAQSLSEKSMVVMRALKQVINDGCDTGLPAACSHELEAFGLCFGSEDAREGVAAFLNKSTPRFQGSLSG